MQHVRQRTQSRAEPKRQALEDIAARWRRYEQAGVDQTISPVDDMFGANGGADYYFRAGRMALELVTDAMILAQRVDFDRVLDLPCGGGRVTRHLKAFFPDAAIHVSDIDPEKQAFVAKQFGAAPHAPTSDFSAPSPEHFDLVFVGSLLTHLPRDLYRAAVNYFIDALRPGGILIASMHGRVAAEIASKSPDRSTRWRHLAAVHGSLRLRGFAYVGSWRMRLRDGVRYGGSFNTIGWATSLIEERRDARVLAVKEHGWMDLQDVLIVQKLSV
jgi:SAM-dependent methyltransferase